MAQRKPRARKQDTCSECGEPGHKRLTCTAALSARVNLSAGRVAKPGWCANGHEGLVTPTQLDPGGPHYPICQRCNTEPVTPVESGYRGYLVDDEDGCVGGPTFAQRVSAAAKRVTGKRGSPDLHLSRSEASEITQKRPPGWIVVLVPAMIGGEARDRAAAEATFAGRPWAAEARYVCISRGQFVFWRPPEHETERSETASSATEAAVAL